MRLPVRMNSGDAAADHPDAEAGGDAEMLGIALVHAARVVDEPAVQGAL